MNDISVENNTRPWFRQFLGQDVRVLAYGQGKKDIVVEGKLIFWDKVSKALVLEVKGGYVFVRHYVTMFSKGAEA